MNWAELLSEIRTDLADTGTSPRWTDAYLWACSLDAIRDYSRWFPRRIDRKELTLSGEAYPLPGNFIDAVVIECPLDTYLEKRSRRPGTVYKSTAYPLSYHVEGGNLYLSGSPLDGDRVYLTYLALHGVPSASDDSHFVVTIPDADIDLIKLYVRAQVHSQMRSKTARLDRFELGSGRRDDNPLSPEVDSLMEEYHRKIAERVRGGVIYLYRSKRAR